MYHVGGVDCVDTVDDQHGDAELEHGFENEHVEGSLSRVMIGLVS